LQGFPNSQITFAGYYRGEPCWVDASFRLFGLGFVYRLEEYNCTPGRNFCTGSEVLNRLIKDGDERVSRFFVELNDENQSLDSAAFMAQKYIELCCSPLIRSLESDGCRTIGGRIHLATVTNPYNPSCLFRLLGKQRTGGFKWIIPPIGEVSSSAP
jgi:hypothetical protein